MHLIDWAIVAGLLAFMTWASIRTRRYNRSVADFLVANRCAGRYVLGVSDSMAGVGAIGIIAWFEAYYQAGFSLAWWYLIFLLISFVTSLSGWIQYRFRQTRALTMAQFLGIRYSRNFRIFAGITAFVSGTLNFGIFPAVGARFFVYFCGLPHYEVPIWGQFSISLTYVLVMAILLAFSLYYTFAGGQITVIVTDFIQGTFAYAVLVIVIALVFIKIPWSHVFETLSQQPPGQSMLNPLDTHKIETFDKWYYLIGAFGMFWTWNAWQGAQGYFASARNAHEARMGRLFGTWRQTIAQLLFMILAIAALVLMRHTDYTSIADNAHNTLNTINDDTIRKQVTTTVALRHFLPTGLFGAFAACMLAAFISTHDTLLHSWGSIFIQDVVLPLRKTRLSPKEHTRLLRWSIFGVAVFIFLFSIFFVQFDFILMFFILTGTIWLGGAGTVIVFGLYWKRGKTSAAYAALIIGIVLFVAGLIVQKTQLFPLPSHWLWFAAMISSIIVYVLISLMGKKTEFNMDKMLHRGKYAIGDDATIVTDRTTPRWQRLLGIGREFTLSDKIVYLIFAGNTIGWGLIFIIVTLYNLAFDVPVSSWAKFWHFYVWLILVLGIVTTVWFTWGGLIDLKKMFHRLSTITRDDTDDGSVAPQDKQSQ